MPRPDQSSRRRHAAHRRHAARSRHTRRQGRRPARQGQGRPQEATRPPPRPSPPPRPPPRPPRPQPQSSTTALRSTTAPRMTPRMMMTRMTTGKTTCFSPQQSGLASMDAPSTGSSMTPTHRSSHRRPFPLGLRTLSAAPSSSSVTILRMPATLPRRRTAFSAGWAPQHSQRWPYSPLPCGLHRLKGPPICSGLPRGPGGCRREAAAALRRLPIVTDCIAFDPIQALSSRWRRTPRRRPSDASSATASTKLTWRISRRAACCRDRETMLLMH